MKYLVVGLGNIGPKYAQTRHNVGFEVVDYLAQSKDVSFEEVSKGARADIKHKGRKIILLKPNTYMNRSGEAVRHWMTKEKIPLERVLIIVDEVALPLGKIRLRGKGSAGGHNGLKNIESQLQTSKYARLRFGIGQNFPKGAQIPYVLGQWTDEEIEVLKEAIPKATEATLSFCSIGLQHTMNAFN
jgi:PTH1 family peptidyl-tRNA hydrolase